MYYHYINSIPFPILIHTFISAVKTAIFIAFFSFLWLGNNIAYVNLSISISRNSWVCCFRDLWDKSPCQWGDKQNL